MTVTPCLILPLRTLAQASADRAAHHTVRDMPRCQWAAGGHRYDLHAYEGEHTIEACMDCGKQRIFPTALNSAHCIVEFPASEIDVLAGSGSRL